MTQDKTVFLTKSKVLPFVEIRKAIRSRACYHAHSHDEFSFGVIDRGTAKYVNMNKKNIICAGDTVTINPGDTHSCNPDSDGWSYRMLFVNTDWVGQLQSEMTGLNNQDYLPFSKLFETDKEFYQRFELLFNALQNESSQLVSETLLMQFLEQCFNGDIKHKKHEHKPNLSKVKELLLDQLNINHSLNDLAQESGLSRYHLVRSFKSIYGLSPHALLLDERIKKAKTLLKSGHSIIDISTQLGFSDQSHFQRNFKKRLAVTPKQYQAFFV